ncbi:CAP domain protein [Metarhizium guizhouense ARSEF 977]|uniref:CAP domain protein n=1 Tax=Metarhizium guizhouense (strain ARSEF 977) TaxID=1276136 RepID=A0A0B4GSM2_METGA|nr:CAP domain protein [Metarhizium guizhouense ARSEF 977]
MRVTLLIIALPLVNAIPRGPPGKRYIEASRRQTYDIGFSATSADVEDISSYSPPPFDIETIPNGNNEISQLSGPGSISGPDSSFGPSQSCNKGTSGSNNTEYMSFINKWRTTIGKPPLEHDALLESNALETSCRSPPELEHVLFKGSAQQVMCGGNQSIDNAVRTWLCERSDLPNMEEACKSFPPGWSGGLTGHADVMSSEKYTKIGCGNKNGIWTCDVACDKPCDFNLNPETQPSPGNSQCNSQEIKE